VLLGLPKSILISCHYFGLKGLKLPIIVTWRTRLTSVKGKVMLSGPLCFGRIRIGFVGVALSSFHEWNTWNVLGKIDFRGKAEFGTGSRIYVGSKGHLTIGDRFLLTANSEIICHHRVQVGNNVLLSWEVLIMDTDSHPIRSKQSEIINHDRPIIVGDRVWIGCRSIILKGTKIKNNSVVAVGSLVHKNYLKNNVLIGGVPATIIMSEIDWEREHFEP